MNVKSGKRLRLGKERASPGTRASPGKRASPGASARPCSMVRLTVAQVHQCWLKVHSSTRSQPTLAGWRLCAAAAGAPAPSSPGRITCTHLPRAVAGLPDPDNLTPPAHELAAFHGALQIQGVRGEYLEYVGKYGVAAAAVRAAQASAPLFQISGADPGDCFRGRAIRSVCGPGLCVAAGAAASGDLWEDERSVGRGRRLQDRGAAL